MESNANEKTHAQEPNQGIVSPETDGREQSNGLASTETKVSHEYITGIKLIAVIVSVSLVGLLIMLDISIISTANPEITTHFRSLPDVGWYTSAYQLANAILQPLTGKLYTYFQAKWTFMAFLIIFEIGNLLCGLSTSSVMLIVGRAIAGCGGSGLMNGGLTIIAGASPIEKRPLYTGLMLGVAQMGLVMGPLIGGALTEHASWRWCFYINLPLGGLAALCIFFIHIPDITTRPEFSLGLVRKVLPELDLVGFALLAPTSTMLLLALQFGANSSHAWNSPTIIGLFCGSASMALLFAAWEHKMQSRAMIPGFLIRNRIVWTSTATMSLLSCCISTASTWLPIYFQAVKGASPTHSGVYMLPSILSQLLATLACGAAVSKFGYYLPFAVSGAGLTALGSGLVSTWAPGTRAGKWIGYQIVLGAGRGAGMQMPILALQTALPPPLTPLSLSLLITAQNLTGALASVLATTIFTQSLAAKLRAYAPSVAPEEALAAGGSAAAVRALGGEGAGLAGVLRAYAGGLRSVFLLQVGLGVGGWVVAWGMGWGDVREEVREEEEEEESAGVSV